MNTETIALAGSLSTQANKLFTSQNRELLASFDMPGVWRAIGSWLQLEARESIEEVQPSLDLYLSVLRRGFVLLFDEGTIVPVSEISKLGSAALNELRRATGLGVESLPQPEPVLTAEQRLEAEVERDWQTLSGTAIRKKRDNSRQYAAALDRLLNSDRLSSQVTSNPVMF